MRHHPTAGRSPARFEPYKFFRGRRFRAATLAEMGSVSGPHLPTWELTIPELRCVELEENPQAQGLVLDRRSPAQPKKSTTLGSRVRPQHQHLSRRRRLVHDTASFWLVARRHDLNLAKAVETFKEMGLVQRSPPSKEALKTIRKLEEWRSRRVNSPAARWPATTAPSSDPAGSRSRSPPPPAESYMIHDYLGRDEEIQSSSRNL